MVVANLKKLMILNTAPAKKQVQKQGLAYGFKETRLLNKKDSSGAFFSSSEYQILKH